jgi:hypothetical protein
MFISDYSLFLVADIGWGFMMEVTPEFRITYYHITFRFP